MTKMVEIFGREGLLDDRVPTMKEAEYLALKNNERVNQQQLYDRARQAKKQWLEEIKRENEDKEKVKI
mgnify:CR=1 FL=1